jgi:hypothetical protein
MWDNSYPPPRGCPFSRNRGLHDERQLLMRYTLLLPLGLLALGGCVPAPTTTTYVTPATTTTTYTPATSTTVLNVPPGYQPSYQPPYAAPPTTTTVYRTQ